MSRTRRRPRRTWAWLVPFFLSGVAQSVEDAPSLAFIVPLTLGLLAGADWHWLNRRPLAPRLFLPSLLVALASAMLAGSRGEPPEVRVLIGLVYWSSVTSGVVLMERVLQWRDRDDWRAPAAPVRAEDETARHRTD